MRAPPWAFPLAELARAEWRLREQSSPAGLAWTLLHPVLLCGALWLALSPSLGRGRADYLPAVAIGVLQFGFFASATGQGAGSLLRRKDLLKNFPVRPWTVVLASILSSALSYAAASGLGLALLAVLGPGPTRAWLLAPALYAAVVSMALGVSLLLAPLALRFPDVPRTWGAALTVLFFLTPVFYRAEQLPAGRRLLVDLNPLTCVIEATRGCLLGGGAPAGRPVAAALGLGLLLAAAGAAAFRAQAPGLGESLAR